MPSASPGPNALVQVLPGAPTESLQALTTITSRQKRYVAYISGTQLVILSGPNTLVQTLDFEEELVAVTGECDDAQLYVASKGKIWVLEAVFEGWTRVTWERALRLKREDASDETRWLSAGKDGELLVGGTKSLSLFSAAPVSRNASLVPSLDATDDTIEVRRPIWSKSIAAAVKYSAFSPSAELIASCGSRDRVVKIWRRLSFEEDACLFDFTYLPHPSAVTHLQWRATPGGSNQRRSSGISARNPEDAEILYTIATDGVLRVWRTGGLHDLDILVLHTTIDLAASIPASPTLSSNHFALATSPPARYVVMLTSEDFSAAVAASAPLISSTKPSHSLEHLREVASQGADIILSFDGHGRMSAWGLHSVGHLRRPENTNATSDFFHIAHAEGLGLRVRNSTNARFMAWFADKKLHLLSHNFTGSVDWWDADIERLFWPTTERRLSKVAQWSGLLEPLSGLRSSEDGTRIVGWSRSSIACWRYAARNWELEWARTAEDVIDAVPLLTDDNCITIELNPQGLVLRHRHGAVLATCEAKGIDRHQRIAASACAGEAVLLIHGHPSLQPASCNLQDGHTSLGNSIQSGLQARASAASVHSGHASTVAFVNDNQLVAYVLGADHTLVQLSSLPIEQQSYSIAAMDSEFLVLKQERETDVVGPSIKILNVRSGYDEFDEVYRNPIKVIAPISNHKLTAIGFDHEVHILLRTQACHAQTQHLWTRIHTISSLGALLGVHALAWGKDQSLVIAAGNGMLIADSNISVTTRKTLDATHSRGKYSQRVPLRQICQRTDLPLAMWHPQVCELHVMQGAWSVAVAILGALHRQLKFYSEGDALDPMLGLDLAELNAQDGSKSPFEARTASDLLNLLDEKELPQLSDAEQDRLKDIVGAMQYCSEHVRGLDDSAFRYLFSWRLKYLAVSRDTPEKQHVPQMSWEEIAFAYNSSSQQPLLDILVLHHDNKVTWDIAKSLGITAWLGNEALAQVFESMAQTSYRAASPPDPTNAALYFLAMHKKPTLLALWRIATGHREQKATMTFLKRDFSLPEHQTAAKKNAYALMGKRRFEYAAAFFLLADDVASATSLLAGQCGEPLLAIAVARLYSGDGSPALTKLVKDRIEPMAYEPNVDRFCISWCQSVTGAPRQKAAEPLVLPLSQMPRPSQGNRWFSDGVARLRLYASLRIESSEHEWSAVLRSSSVLRDMGMPLLALQLVRDWRFITPSPTKSKKSEPAQVPTQEPKGPSLLDDFIESSVDNSSKGGMPGAASTKETTTEPPSMLDSFADSPPAVTEQSKRADQAAAILARLQAKKAAAANVQSHDAGTDEKKEKKEDKKKAPTQFTEPSGESLLDSFGF